MPVLVLLNRLSEKLNKQLTNEEDKVFFNDLIEKIKTYYNYDYEVCRFCHMLKLYVRMPDSEKPRYKKLLSEAIIKRDKEFSNFNKE